MNRFQRFFMGAGFVYFFLTIIINFHALMAIFKGENLHEEFPEQLRLMLLVAGLGLIYSEYMNPDNYMGSQANFQNNKERFNSTDLV